jgi:hypothetical protein
MRSIVGHVASSLFDFDELADSLDEQASASWNDGADNAFDVEDPVAATKALEEALVAWAVEYFRCKVHTFADEATATEHKFERREDEDDEEGEPRFFLDGEELREPEDAETAGGGA